MRQKNSEHVIFLSFSATFPSFKKVFSVLLCTAPPIFLPEARFLLADSLVMSRVVNEGGVTHYLVQKYTTTIHVRLFILMSKQVCLKFTFTLDQLVQGADFDIAGA